MSNENTDTDDLRDRLIDGALREVVGQETPPDLSEQILFAATGERSSKLSTRAPGAETMATQHQQAIKKRNLFVGLVVAASLLVVAGFMLPAFQAARERARSTRPAAPGGPTYVASVPEGRDGRLKRNSTDDLKASVEALRENAEKENSEATADFDELVDLITSTVEAEGWGAGEGQSPGEAFTPNLDLVISQAQTVQQGDGQQSDVESSPTFSADDSLVMGVTPKIIFSEEEPRQLGRHSADDRDKSWEMNDYALGQTSNGVEAQAEHQPITPQSGDIRFDIPTTGGQPAQTGELAGGGRVGTNLARNRGYGLGGKPTSDRFSSVNDLNGDGVVDAAKPATPADGVTDLAVKVYPVADLVLPLPDGVNEELFGSAGEPVTDGLDIAGAHPSLEALSNEKSEAAKKQRGRVRRLDESNRTKLSLVDSQSTADFEFAKRRVALLEKEYLAEAASIRFGDQRGEKLAKLEAEITRLRRLEEGRGADASGDKYKRIYENPFVKAIGEKAVSTFSIDVDTASYANVRQFLMDSGQLPPPDAVRIEELVNYFNYGYSAPTGDTPFASHVEVAGCPWKADHRLVRVGIKGREVATEKRPLSNLVFLIDVSGSMDEPAKLPLLVQGMKMLTRELGENDRVAIVVYASSEGLALPSTRGDKQAEILTALNNLRAGGSTAGGAGIQLAYEIAEENFIEGGVNRVILATDGDFNVGITGEGALTRMAEDKAKNSGVFLTVLGFGRGNLDDSMLESISGAGNGNYHYVDNKAEARKVLVEEMAGTLVTIAKDVKIQIEFNPAQVAAYRLIGYENRMLKTEDFNDDKKDAGEIGAGHTVTAIYEIVPAGKSIDTPAVDPLKYQDNAAKPASDADASDELLTLKLRYKQPDGGTSTKVEFPITDEGQSFAEASDDFKFASAVASFGMLLRNSAYQGHTSYSAVEEIAQQGTGTDQHGYRAEFLQMVRQAKQLAGE